MCCIGVGTAPDAGSEEALNPAEQQQQQQQQPEMNDGHSRPGEVPHGDTDDDTGVPDDGKPIQVRTDYNFFTQLCQYRLMMMTSQYR